MSEPAVSSSSAAWESALEAARAAGRHVSRIGEDPQAARVAAERRHAERYRAARAEGVPPVDAAMRADVQDSADAVRAFAALAREHYARLLDASRAA